MGIRLGRLPAGPQNCITDVEGIQVGHCTLSHGDGPEAIRSGVTAIIPNPSWAFHQNIRAGVHVLNGAGEMTCLSQIREWGYLETPIVLSSTMAVGICYHALAKALALRFPQIGGAGEVVIPVVAECDDSFLSNAGLFPIGPEHVNIALKDARGGPVAQGCVGAGTGMMAFDFKGGIGSASRRLPHQEGYTLGCLVLANFGRHQDLRLPGLPPGLLEETLRGLPIRPDVAGVAGGKPGDQGSLIVILATDAPLHSHDLCRLAQRAGLGAARLGANAYNGSGDIFLAFTTANPIAREDKNRAPAQPYLEGQLLDPFFLAAAEACEEAIFNALCAAHETIGRNGNRAVAFPTEWSLKSQSGSEARLQ